MGRWLARGRACAHGWITRVFWRRVGARARLDPADFGGNGQILMRSIQWSCALVEQQLGDEDSEEGRNGERVCDLGEETVNS